MTCQHCGATCQNGARFCPRCGTPLVAAPSGIVMYSPGQVPAPSVPPSPPGAVPPAFAPPDFPRNAAAPFAGYMSPGYGHAALPPQRLSFSAIVAVTTVLLGILACIAIVVSHGASNDSLPSLYPSPVPQASAVPVASPTAGNTPVQQPAATSVPTSAPPSPPTAPPVARTAVPVQPSGAGGQTVSNSMFSLQISSGCQVVVNTTSQTENKVVLQDTGSGPNALEVLAGQSTNPTNAQAVLQAHLATIQQRYPDATPCGQATQVTASGIAGMTMRICYTFTPQSGAAVSAVEIPWAGTNAGGTIAFFFASTAGGTDKKFWTEATKVVESIRWVTGQ